MILQVYVTVEFWSFLWHHYGNAIHILIRMRWKSEYLPNSLNNLLNLVFHGKIKMIPYKTFVLDGNWRKLQDFQFTSMGQWNRCYSFALGFCTAIIEYLESKYLAIPASDSCKHGSGFLLQYISELKQKEQAKICYKYKGCWIHMQSSLLEFKSQIQH